MMRSGVAVVLLLPCRLGLGRIRQTQFKDTRFQAQFKAFEALALSVALPLEYRGAMERRATVLPRFAKKSTSSWLKGALQAYALDTRAMDCERKQVKVTTRGSQVKARTKEMSLQTLELGLVLIDTEGKTCVMDALDAT
ncbi:hypothetical protein Tco_0265278 [Tanacetum coccineum]